MQQALLYVLTTGTIAAWTELAMAHNIDLLDVEGEMLGKAATPEVAFQDFEWQLYSLMRVSMHQCPAALDLPMAMRVAGPQCIVHLGV